MKSFLLKGKLNAKPRSVHKYKQKNGKKLFQALEIGKTFGEDVVYGYPYQTGEKSHEMPQKRCILLPPKVDCKKAPWQRANHLGNIFL